LPRFEHTFVMSEPPEEAQERFQSQIGPALRRVSSFRLYHHSPGRLLYSDGRKHVADVRAHRGALLGWGIRSLTSRRIRVEFSRSAAGTTVRIRGSALREVRDALLLLGTSGHWPSDRRAGAD
jgi:hypothetical protein